MKVIKMRVVSVIISIPFLLRCAILEDFLEFELKKLRGKKNPARRIRNRPNFVFSFFAKYSSLLLGGKLSAYFITACIFACYSCILT